MTAVAPQSDTLLAPKLGPVHVGLREDLEVTRHLFRGHPSYIIRDPITFQSQRLEPADYEIFVGIDAGQSLSEVFDGLVKRGKATPAQAEEFYKFILGLHRLGFLRLPISDSKLLFRRHQAKQAARRREKLLGFLFLRIPLWCPNAFLDRTVRHARFLFSKTALVLWTVLMVAAGYVLVRHWNELREPLEGLLAARNLVLMWLTLVVLKVFHEFGHAYACKHFGGHVPEMGAYLIVFTPCAYMDATASWGFTRKRDRIIVCLAGVYVESIIAAAAVFAWAFTDASLLHSLAYNVIFLAGVVTVLFNINPLMRYDGYYICSDLTEVPNLRARSNRYVLSILKRILLGIPSTDVPASRRLRFVLFTYGIAATLYRAALLLGIAAILATKMFVVGLLLAVFFLGSTVVMTLRKLIRYLWHSEETAALRWRATAVGLLVLVIIPAALVFVPVPSHVHARGVLTTEHETVVRAKTPGFLVKPGVQRGQLVRPFDLLAELVDDSSLEKIAEARANLWAAEIRRDAFQIEEPDRALQEGDRANAYRLALEQGRRRLADLQVRTPSPGRVVSCLSDDDVGSFLEEGTAVATIAAGRWRVRAILSEPELLSARPQAGDTVAFRAVTGTAQTIEGTIVRVDPAGSRIIELSPLTHLGGGAIAIAPETGKAKEPYFELIVDLPEVDSPHLRHGMTGYVRLPGAADPIATTVLRRLTRFINKLMQE